MKIPKSTPLTRLALALAVSPLVTAALLNTWILIIDVQPAWRNLSMPMKDTIGFSYLVVVLLGLPLAGVFSLLRWKRWWHYAAAGFVLGAGLMILGYQLLPAGEVPVSGGGNHDLPVDWPRTWIIAWIASMTALAFWWLRYGNLRRLGSPSASE